jgi:hypothetical protein
MAPGDPVTSQAPPNRPREKQASQAVSPAANRKIERLAHRELIYSVVRDTMIRASVLAANYKFKVLSLDAHGREYLVMMDLSNQNVGNDARLADIEAMMVQTAKLRHDLLVNAVYWRVHAPVTTAPAPPPHPAALQAGRSSTVRAPVTAQAPRHAPLQESEIAAFKQARARTTPATPRPGPVDVLTPPRRNPTRPADFEDTQLVGPDEGVTPLSSTQYGDLH